MKLKNNLIYFLLCSLVSISACKKEDEDEDDSEDQPVIVDPTPYEFSARFDGVNKTMMNASGYGYYYCSGTAVQHGSSFYVEPCTGLEQIVSDEDEDEDDGDVVEVSFKNYKYLFPIFLGSNQDSIFHTVLDSGTFIYTDSTSKGVQITYTDVNSDVWTTIVGDQSGSTFEITESTALPNDGNYAYHIIKCSFSCKLYNTDGSGTYKTLTNGYGYLKYTFSY